MLVALKRLTLHEAVPLHGPALHPTKLDPLAGVAVRLMLAPLTKLALHEATEQLIPAGLEVTRPAPVMFTVRGYGPAPPEKFAVTLWLALIVRVQEGFVPWPVHAPPQPVNAPVTGVAVRVTGLPLAKFALHEATKQLIPAGLEVTKPVPDTDTLRGEVGPAVNVAVTDRAWLIVTWQVPLPVQSPDQCAKLEPLAGLLAKSVTSVPLTSGVLVQVPVLFVQVIPPALAVTVPDPEPVVLTFRV